MTYRERREARAERLKEWAAKRETKAAAVFKAGEHYRGDYAFNTQPGHIPERARLIAREHRACESLEKARSMSSRAAGIADQLDRSIYSDDPDAKEQLEERIASLEAERERVKAYNASCRKGARDIALLDDAQKRDIIGIIQVQPYACKGGAFPSYHLSNLSGNIKRNKDRLATLGRPTVPVYYAAAKYAGTCTACALPTEKGAPILYNKAEHTVMHETCYKPQG